MNFVIYDSSDEESDITVFKCSILEQHGGINSEKCKNLFVFMLLFLSGMISP